MEELILNSKSLRKLTDLAVGEFLLQQDHLYRKIPAEEKKSLIQQAIETGQTAATSLKSADLDTLLREAEITIDFFEQNGESKLGYTLAELQLPNKINLNQSLLQDGVAVIKKNPALKFMTEQASLQEILIVHEFFHYWENQQKLFTLEKHLDYKVGFIKRSARLFSLSEIAANAFAKTLLQLDFQPILLTPVLVYQTDPSYSGEFIQYFTDN